MSAFNTAWDLMKMPFVIEDDGNLQTDILNQGRRTGDKNTKHWTIHINRVKSTGLCNVWMKTTITKAGAFVDANGIIPNSI